MGKPSETEAYQPCRCGCGTLRPTHDNKGRPRLYIHGHNTRGQVIQARWKEEHTPRTSHDRAVILKADVTECEWLHIGECFGRLEVAHINQDEMDNDPANLLKLCASHHRLLDKGRIDPVNPVMPWFWVDSSGKRRYFPGGHRVVLTPQQVEAYLARYRLGEKVPALAAEIGIGQATLYRALRVSGVGYGS